MFIPVQSLDHFIGGMIAVGIFQCILGYRLFRVVLHLTGFCVAGTLSVEYGRMLFQGEAALLITGLLGGLAGAVLVVWLYYLFVFLMGGYLGFILTHILSVYLKITPDIWWFFGVFLIFGSISLSFQRVMLMFSTAYTGAFNAVAGIHYFFWGSRPVSGYDSFFIHDGWTLYLISACWILAGTIGFWIQMKYTPEELSEDEKKGGTRLAFRKKKSP